MVSEEAVILTVPLSDFSTNSKPLESEGLIFDSDFERELEATTSLFEFPDLDLGGFVFTSVKNS